MAEAEETQWITLWCESDSSFSLVKESQVVCDPDNLRVGDTVTFVYQHRNFKGTVRRIGGVDEFDEMSEELKELNKSNKAKQDSFHEDRPRKAATRSRDATRLLASVRGKSANASRRTDKKPGKKSQSSRYKDEVSEHSTSTSSETDDDQPLSAVHSHKKQTHQEQSMKDVLKLKHLNATQKAKSSKDSGTLEGMLESEETSDKEVGMHKLDKTVKKKDTNQAAGVDSPPLFNDLYRAEPTGVAGAKPYEDSDEEQGEKTVTPAKSAIEDEPSAKRKSDKTKRKTLKESKQDEPHKKKSKSVSPTFKNPLLEGGDLDSPPVTPSSSADSESFDGETYRYKSSDSSVCELKGNKPHLCGVYISEDDLRKAKDSSNNASKYARKLLESVFSDKALNTCSLAGGEYRAGGKANISKRPALPSVAVDIIIDIALNRQTARTWNPRMDRKSIRSSLRQKLVDIRGKNSADPDVS